MKSRDSRSPSAKKRRNSEDPTEFETLSDFDAHAEANLFLETSSVPMQIEISEHMSNWLSMCRTKEQQLKSSKEIFGDLIIDL